MKKVIILPLDGFASGQESLEKAKFFMAQPGMSDLVGFIKVNDAVHNYDMGGPEIVRQLGSKAGIFLDLKIFDVSATVVNTIKKYSEALPTILTVASNCSVETIVKLRLACPEVKLALVSALTDMSASECQSRFGMLPAIKIYNDLENIRQLYQKIDGINAFEPFDFVVCSAHELEFLRRNLSEEIGFIVPGIRDVWMKNPKDHQKRTVGVAEALSLGATYVVMGAQITKGNPEFDVSAETSRELTLEAIKEYFYRSAKIPETDLLNLMKQNGAYYGSPKDAAGKYLGPLVAYAGTYLGDNGVSKNKVGFEYFNFAKIEEYAHLREPFVQKIVNSVGICASNLVVGAPMGGIILAADIATALGSRVAFAEKEITVLADSKQGTKEVSSLVIKRHDICPGDEVFIVEDVCNNFSTTEKLKEEIEIRGGILIGIMCAINRSGKSDWNGLPVFSALAIPTAQYEQEDSEVCDLVNSGNIVWKPKQNWEELSEAMGK